MLYLIMNLKKLDAAEIMGFPSEGISSSGVSYIE